MSAEKRIKIISIIGAFLFISPNLKLTRSLLYYFGVAESNLRMYAIAIFFVFDLAILAGTLYLRLSKGSILVLLLITTLSVSPLIMCNKIVMSVQYFILVFPLSLIALLCAENTNV